MWKKEERGSWVEGGWCHSLRQGRLAENEVGVEERQSLQER